MDLIKELLKKINPNNANIMISLSSIITSEKIESLDKLLEYENNRFKTNGMKMSKGEQIQYCIEILDSFPYEYDELDYDEIQIYKKYRKILDNTLSSMDDKILSIIILFNMTHRELPFPYETYQYIIDGRL